MVLRRPLLPLAAGFGLALICAAAPLGELRAAGQGRTPQLEQLRQELVRLGRAQQAGESVSDGWKRKLLELNARQADLDRRMGQNRDSLVQMMGALQMFRRDPPPSLLVNPRSAKNAVRAAILIRAVLPELEARRRDYVAEANELNRIRRDAAVAGAALLSAASAEADRRSRIDQLVAAKRGLETAADPAAAARAAAAAAKARNADELVGDLASSDRADPAPDADSRPVALETPVHGRLVRRFGAGIRGSDSGRRSTGLAWRTEPSALVISPADCDVDYAGPIKGFGLVVILKLKGEYRVVLGGLDRVTALTGRHLAAGEPIGQMSAQGPSELLLEIRRAQQPINPAPWLKL